MLMRGYKKIGYVSIQEIKKGPEQISSLVERRSYCFTAIRSVNKYLNKANPLKEDHPQCVYPFLEASISILSFNLMHTTSFSLTSNNLNAFI